MGSMRHIVFRGLICLAGLLAGCGQHLPQQALKVYHHSLDEAPTTLDPAHAATTYTGFLVVNAYDTLYSYKYLARPYELKPNLAAAMPTVSDDGLVYTIPINKGVHFINDPAFPGGKGREVTAADVIYSLERHFDPATRSQGRWLWQDRIEGLDAWHDAGADYAQPVAGLEAVDSHTLRITLTRPYPQFVYTLASPFSAVVPHEAVEKYGSELAVHPVGSGPFKVTTFDSTKAVLEPNSDWRWKPVDLAAEGYDPATEGGLGLEAIDGRTPPFVDSVEVDFVGESSARWNSFTKGDELQYTLVPNEQADNLLAGKHPVTLKPEYASKYHARDYLEAGLVYLGFNLDDPAIGYNHDPERQRRNRALRCAIRKAYDWHAHNRKFQFGLGEIFPGVIPPMLKEYPEDLSRQSVTRDLAGARKLLEENGWNADSLPVLTYGYASSVKERQAFEQFRGFLEDIGYPADKVQGRPYASFGEYSRALKQQEVKVFYLSWLLDYPDAQNILQLFYGPHGSPGSNNTNYDNPDYDALYDQASVMPPSEHREELYQRMNRMLIDDCAVISGLARRRIMMWHDDVIALPDQGIVGGYFLKYVALKKDGG